MTRENWRSTTGRVWPEHVSGMARGVDAMDIIECDGIVGGCVCEGSIQQQYRGGDEKEQVTTKAKKRKKKGRRTEGRADTEAQEEKGGRAHEGQAAEMKARWGHRDG